MKNTKQPTKVPPWHTICVTLDCGLIEKLTDFAYEGELARSAVVEYALLTIFGEKDEQAQKRLANRIKEAGFDRSTRRNRYAKKSPRRDSSP